MEADGWAFSLNVLGEDEALNTEEFDLGLYMLLREEDGTFRSRSNAYFAELLNSKEKNKQQNWGTWWKLTVLMAIGGFVAILDYGCRSHLGNSPLRLLWR